VPIDGDAVDQVESVLLWIVLAGAAVAAVVGIWKALRGINRFFEKTNRFFDDWYGHPAEDGHPSRKGVLHRLDDLEANREANTVTLHEIKDQVVKELNRNGGSSAKDAAFEAVRVSQETLVAVQGVQLQLEEEVLERKAWADKYEADVKKQKHERKEIAKLVLRMIDKSPEEQMALWNDGSSKWVDGTLGDGENID
jgi:acetolactate synthase small subunit